MALTTPTTVTAAATTTAKAPAERFTGDAWVDTIAGGSSPGGARLAKVWFAPGARTAWHRHVRGQTLHVTDGHGLVQARDEPAVHLTPGVTVHTAAGVWHWHGALPDRSMCHLALSEGDPDPSTADVEWGDHISVDDVALALSQALTTAQVLSAEGEA